MHEKKRTFVKVLSFDEKPYFLYLEQNENKVEFVPSVKYIQFG